MKLISNKRVAIYLSIFIFSISLLSIFSCKREDSLLEVSGGEVISNQQYPGVILLIATNFDLLTTQGKEYYTCTGSVLSSNTILTAAHCTDTKNYKYMYAIHPYKKGKDIIIPAKSSYRHPSFGDIEEKGLSEYQVAHDVGVWVFQEGVFSDIADRLQISNEPPRTGTNVMLVGWGCYTTIEAQDEQGEGGQNKAYYQVCDRNKNPDKRKGFNKIHRVSYDGSYITMYARSKDQIDDKNTNPTGENVLSTQGDSGGPLLSKNDTKKIFGICSAGSSRLGPYEDSWLSSLSDSLYTNPVSRDNQNFLESIVDKSDAVIPGIQVGVNVVEYKGKIKVLYKEEPTEFNKKVEEHKVIKSFNNKSFNSVENLKRAWRGINFYNRIQASWSFE